MGKRTENHPNKKINRTNAAKMLNDINRSLQSIGRQIDNAKKDIDEFCSEPDLKGDGFKSIKNYFNSGHGSLLLAFYGSINAMINTNLIVSRKINSTITHNGDLDYSKIYNGYSELFDLVEELEKQKENLRKEIVFLNRDEYSQVCQELRKQKDLLAKAEELLDELDAFFKFTEKGAASIWTQIDKLKGQMDSFVSYAGYDVNKGEYELPKSFKAKDIVDNLEKIMSDDRYVIKDLDPINMATGNYIYNKRFLVIPGKYPIDFILTYNSASKDDGANLSRGWTHNFDVQLKVSSTTAVITIDSGRQETYILRDNKYLNDHGDNDRVLEKIDGNQDEYAYKYTNEKNDKYYFNSAGECGRIEHANGDAFALAYDAGKIKSIRTKNDCGFNFVYAELGESPFIKEIIDNAGRKIVFEYDEKLAGNRTMTCLTSIADEESNIYRYGYDDSGRMNQVTNARGTINLINEYDISGRVQKQQFPDQGECYISYNDFDGCIAATLQNGNEIRYYHDHKARNTKTVYLNGSEEFTYTDSNAKATQKDRNGNVTSFEYNENGELIKETDAAGNIYETEYDAERRITAVTLNGRKLYQQVYDDAGNIIEEIDALGRRTATEYNAENLPEVTTNADGSTVYLNYDSKGNITEITDENGFRSMYSYDELNRVTIAVDANGNKEQYEYNNRNEITKSVNAANDCRVFEYNESGKLIHTIDYDGNEEFAEYNELNKLSAYIDKDGNRTEYGYDKMWNITSIKDPEGNISVRTFDRNGNLIREIDPLYATTSYDYDANGNLISQTDAEGIRTNYEYDCLNQMTKIGFLDGTEERYEYDALGNVINFIDASGNEWKSEYNAAGELVKEINPEGLETIYTYDLAGKLIEENAGGIVTFFEYDNVGNIIKRVHPNGSESVYTYEPNGNLKSETLQGVKTSYHYDCLNRVIEIRRENDLLKSFEYDKVGNKIAVIDAFGNKTKYIRSKAGDILSVIDPIGHETHYSYDKCHRLIEIDQGDGRITKYKRDSVGNILTVTDALGNTESYEYDGNSKVIAKTDMDGNRTEVVRNMYGDIAKIKYADSSEVEYSYDLLRRLKEVRDSLGTTTIERDKLGREIKITDHKNRSVSYSFDKLGNRTGIIYPSGKSVQYKYVNSKLESIASGDAKTELAYDAYGRLLSRKTGVDSTVYTYNNTGLLDSLTNSEAGEVLDSFIFGYNKNGDVSSIEKTRSGLPEEDGLYSYDYDPLGRLTRVGKNGDSLREYSYDALGNRTSKRESGKTIQYIYNEASQLIALNDGESETVFDYDKRGNIIKKSNGSEISSFSYNAANRIASATNSKGVTAKYTYNGLGFRVSKISENNSFDYILDQTMMYNNLLEAESKAETKDYVWCGDTLISESGELVHTDYIGTPIRIGDNTFSYDEFGVPVFGEGNVGFTGYIQDEVSGMHFAQAREYMPEMGRFAGRDVLKGVVETPKSLNEYAYCHNEPIGFVDFDGMKPRKSTPNDYAKGMTKGGLENAGSKFAEDKLGNSVNHWEKGVTKNIYREFDHDIRVNSNRALNSARPGRAAGAAAKLEQLQGSQAAKLQQVGSIGEAGKFAAKWGPSAAIGAASVGYDYYNDYNSGLSSSKIRSNAGVNAAYAVGGIGVTAVGTYGVAAGASALAVAGPPGWLVAGAIGAVWGLVTVATSDKSKNLINSLD